MYMNLILSIPLNIILCQEIYLRHSSLLQKTFLDWIQQSLFGLTVQVDP